MSNKIIRKNSIRNKIKAISLLPRLTVQRTNAEIYAQIIDSKNGKVLASASSLKVDVKKNKTEIAYIVGQDLGKMAKKSGITKVAFDRGENRYHGRVLSLAKGARDCGLIF